MELAMLRDIYIRPAGLMAAIEAQPASEVRGAFRLVRASAAEWSFEPAGEG